MIYNLFVDVDDTLLISKESPDKKNPWLFYEDEYEVNLDLLMRLFRFKKLSPNTKIWIWSGGGQAYARKVSEHIFPRFFVSEPVGKGDWLAQVVRPNDVFIDDDRSIVLTTMHNLPTDKIEKCNIMTEDEFSGFLYRIENVDMGVLM